MEAEQPVARSVPIGCEFVDQTLGCAANSPLTVHLNFQAPPGSKAQLRLTNVPAGLQPAVGAQFGTVKRVNASTIEIGPGLGSSSGFVSNATPSPVASVTFDVPKQAVEATPNPWLIGPASAAQVRLDLKQAVGNYIADRTSITHFYYPCKTKTTVDQIVPVPERLSIRGHGCLDRCASAVAARRQRAD